MTNPSFPPAWVESHRPTLPRVPLPSASWLGSPHAPGDHGWALGEVRHCSLLCLSCCNKTTLCPWVSSYMGRALMLLSLQGTSSYLCGLGLSPPVPSPSPGANSVQMAQRTELPVDPKLAFVGHMALEEKYLNGAHKANQTEAPPTDFSIVHPPPSPGTGEPGRAARMAARVACLIWRRIRETESAQQERGRDTV